MMAGQGNALVPIALVGWIPFVSVLFSRLHPRQAAAIAFALAWMFLPVAAIPLKGLPDFTKVTATCSGILLAAWWFDRERLLAFRPGLVDLPMLLWCTCPFLSSVFNGLGAYDGLSESMYQTFTWGLPYLVARVYFSDLEGLTTLAVVVFVGGLLYIPFCFVEMVMSPQMHRWTYGFHQHSFLQSIRGDGFRPMVYMEHGLMVAMWMVSGATLGIWLHRSGVLPAWLSRITGTGILSKVPFWLLLAAQLVTTALMKSSGAFFLFMLGLATLFFSQKTKSAILVWLLLAVPPAYMISRSTGWWNGENLTSFIAEKYSAERAQSLQFRFDNETMLVKRALDGTFFGWGGWNRSRVFDLNGKDLSVTDGLWIITLGTRGIYGLTVLTVVILLPVVLLLSRSRPEQWRSAEFGAVAAMSVLLALYMIDNLLNGMVNPIFMLFNGGINGLLARGIPASTAFDQSLSTLGSMGPRWLGSTTTTQPRFLSN